MESTEKTSRHRRQPTNCKICDGLAIHSYVGVIVCASCKMFFKRHAQLDQSNWRCRSNGQCQVNIHQRPICSVCRMKKCLTFGMKTDLFRDGVTKKNKCSTINESITTLTLLQSDSSTLSTEQWTHLSNIIHCYDQFSQKILAHRYVDEQTRLPIRIRFHSSSIHDLFVQLIIGGRLLIVNNGDLSRISSSDRSIVIRNTTKTVSALSLILIGSTSQIFQIPVCRDTLNRVYGESPSEASTRAGKRLDADETFVKLIISSLIFSTFHYLDYDSENSIMSYDIRTILQIQDRYIELAWRYMIYKYDHQRAVRSFSNLILSLMALHQSLMEVSRVEKYNQTMNSLMTKSVDDFQ